LKQHPLSRQACFGGCRIGKAVSSKEVFSKTGVLDGGAMPEKRQGAEHLYELYKLKRREKMKTATLPGFSRYLIYDEGRVAIRATGKMMKAHDDSKNGYLKLKLTNDDGVRIHFWFNRLIYTAFNGPIPAGMEVDHIDGNRLNNHLENLSLVTHKQNCVLKKQRDRFFLFNRQAKKKGRKII
jgi:hypothetical protein